MEVPGPHTTPLLSLSLSHTHTHTHTPMFAPTPPFQVVRSTPGILSTLVGHKAREHVESNVKVRRGEGRGA